MPALRHIAVSAKDPARLAEYYKTVFEMQEVRRSAGGAVYLSDGVMSLVLLPQRPDGPTAELGPNHFGFQVEDVAGAFERARVQHNLRTARRCPSNRRVRVLGARQTTGRQLRGVRAPLRRRRRPARAVARP